ncbi:MAG: hypothetical protein CMJ31_02690 [Phycisphaerae bacterium]|nr:hypothetical protein [Phycisphaerae bacterium]
MASRLLAILITLSVGFQSLVGGGQGVAVLCFGGGHSHAEVDADHCHDACEHDRGWPLPVRADESESDCGCTDVAVELVDFGTEKRADDGPAIEAGSKVAAVVVLAATAADRGSLERGTRPPKYDPGGRHRLAVVSATRLII